MSENLGTIYYTVEADTSRLLNSTKPVNQSLEGMKRGFKDTDAAAGAFEMRMTKTASAVRGLGGASGAAISAVKGLTVILGALATVQTAVAVVQIAESYGQMAERLRMASASAEEYETVQSRLLRNANETYRPLAEAQELYILTADSLRSVGYETSQVLDIIDSLSMLFVTNATTADKASSAIQAFTNSVNKGKVEADAWATIIAATPTIVNAIAESTGRAAADVRALGVAGQLTAYDLNEGLRKSLDVNREAAAGMDTSINDAITRIRNNLSVLIGRTNEATGVTGNMADAINGVATAIEKLDYKRISEEVAGLQQYLGLLGDEVVSATNLIIDLFGKSDKEISFSMKNVARNTAYVFDSIEVMIGGLSSAFSALGQNIEIAFDNAFSAVTNAARRFSNSVASSINKTLDALNISARINIAEIGTEAAKKEFIGLKDAFDKGMTDAMVSANRHINVVGEQAALSAKLQAEEALRKAKEAADLLQEGANRNNPPKPPKPQPTTTKPTGGRGAGRSEDNALKREQEEMRRAAEDNARIIAQLNEEIYQTSLNAEELAVRKAKLALNKFATPEEVAQVEAMARALFSINENRRAAEAFGTGADADKYILGQTDPLNGGAFDDQYARYEAEAQAEQQRYAEQLARLEEARRLKIETNRSYDDLEYQAAQDHAARMSQIEDAKGQVVLSSAKNTFASLADVMKQSAGEQSRIYKVMFAASKAFAIAESIVAIQTAIAKAAASGPFPANLAAMAGVAAATAGLVSTITSTNISGGRQYGGPVAGGKMYRINETGAPEILNTASGQQFLLPNSRGEVVSNKDATAGGGSNVVVNVVNNAQGANVNAKSRQDDRQTIIDIVVNDIAQDGRTADIIQGRFGLSPRGI